MTFLLRVQSTRMMVGSYLEATLLQGFATDLEVVSTATDIAEFYRKRELKFGPGKVTWRRLSAQSIAIIPKKELQLVRVVEVDTEA